MDLLLKKTEKFSLWAVSYEGLPHFAEFVSDANFEIHQGKKAPREEIENFIFHENELFKHSFFYAVKLKTGEYVGAVRITLWDGKFALPMSREFGVDINKILRDRNLNPTEIWHIARLAVNSPDNAKNRLTAQERNFVLKTLLARVISIICRYEDNVMLAECDERFLQMTPRIGIVNNEVVGDPVMYLGSKTIPVINTAKNLSSFLKTERKRKCTNVF